MGGSSRSIESRRALSVGRLPQTVAVVLQYLPRPSGIAGQDGPDLRQRHFQETQRPDPLGVAGLGQRVVAVPGVLIYRCRRKQTELIVVAQRRDREPADFRKATDR
jgi:hypothetical protein